MNNSQSGGYLAPITENNLPGQLTFTQFLNTLFVGISGLTQTMVRPTWQVAPPKQPDLTVNWMAYGVTTSTPTPYSFAGAMPDGSFQSQRHEALEIQCQFLGPQAFEYALIVRDGFQIPQNLAALTKANMGFTETGSMQHIPDLVNERWINRVIMSVFLQREIIRTYPVVSFLSAGGIIYAENPAGTDKTIDFSITQT